MKALVYCRVSTAEQAKEGYSLQAQERICRAYAERFGYAVDRVFIERGESGKTTHRPELQNLLKYASKNHGNIDALILYKLDRLSRNMVDHTVRCSPKTGQGHKVVV